MARYIDADKFKSHLEKAMEKMHLIGGVKGVDVGAVIMALDRQPTADVAPKSEVENYKQVAEYQQKLAMDRYFQVKQLRNDNEHLAVMLEEAKQGVDGFPCVAYNKKHERYQVIHKGKQGHIFASKLYRCRKEAENALAELKKKYTGEKA